MSWTQPDDIYSEQLLGGMLQVSNILFFFLSKVSPWELPPKVRGIVPLPVFSSEVSPRDRYIAKLN